jgi:hypothetical protein
MLERIALLSLDQPAGSPKASAARDKVYRFIGSFLSICQT